MAAGAIRSRFLKELARAIDARDGAGRRVVAVVRAELLAHWPEGERPQRELCRRVAARYRLEACPWFIDCLMASAEYWRRITPGGRWWDSFVMPIIIDGAAAALVKPAAERMSPADDEEWDSFEFGLWQANRPRGGVPQPADARPPVRETGRDACRALVHFHCLGLPLARVAALLGAAPRTVAARYTRAAAALGIALRPPLPPGRPPKCTVFPDS